MIMNDDIGAAINCLISVAIPPGTDPEDAAHI
jgi:hypothetical protein